MAYDATCHECDRSNPTVTHRCTLDGDYRYRVYLCDHCWDKVVKPFEYLVPCILMLAAEKRR